MSQLALKETDRCLNVLPLFHIGGWLTARAEEVIE